MNSDEIWLLQLWSGAIGSFVSAVVGGLVALLVVRLTNGQQRRQAELNREIAAIAEFIAQCASMAGVFDIEQISDPERAFVSFEVALVRLEMSSNDMKDVAEVVAEWPTTMTELTVFSRDADNGQPELSQKIHSAVLSAAATASAVLSGWPSDNAGERRTTLSMLQERTDALRECRREMEQARDGQPDSVQASSPRANDGTSGDE